mgnify:CR=1 FL=1
MAHQMDHQNEITQVDIARFMGEMTANTRAVREKMDEFCERLDEYAHAQIMAMEKHVKYDDERFSKINYRIAYWSGGLAALICAGGVVLALLQLHAAHIAAAQ